MCELMSQQMSLSEEECEAVNRYIPIQEFAKGTVLLQAGNVANDSYFTLKGCVRLYYLVDGEDKTTQFFTEGDAIASMNSYINRVPANHFLECVEDCTLAVLNYEKEKKLYKLFPKLESICRISMEDDFGKQQEMLASHVTNSPEQRYQLLLKQRGDLVQRVPQYHLASYLGVKPESLSRIRKRLADKERN